MPFGNCLWNPTSLRKSIKNINKSHKVLWLENGSWKINLKCSSVAARSPINSPKQGYLLGRWICKYKWWIQRQTFRNDYLPNLRVGLGVVHPVGKTALFLCVFDLLTFLSLNLKIFFCHLVTVDKIWFFAEDGYGSKLQSNCNLNLSWKYFDYLVSPW